MPIANRKAQSALRLVDFQPQVQEGDKYQVLFEQASDAIMILDRDGKIDEVNSAFQELTGYLPKGIKGETWSVLSPKQETRHIPVRSRPLDQQSCTTSGTYEDVAIVRWDGYVRLVDLSVRVIKSQDKVYSVCLLRDVTEKKQMERELITKHSELKNAYVSLEKMNAELKTTQATLVQAGKMAALGELAAGIAHEINQPLQGIRGYTQELQSLLDPAIKGAQGEGEIRMFLKEVISNVDKMSGIIQYLRVFTRKSTENHEFTDIHERIEEALKMLSRQFESRGIKVKRNFAREIPQVYANPLQLEQVFINLAANARDAIETTGRGKGLVEITTRASDRFVEIEVQDDGIGMDQRSQSKIFNPFFTTKEVGKGMGLGLSISYGILNKLHGSILVESEVGKGAKFVIRVPRDFREMA